MKYFVSYTWHNDKASGHGRLEVFYNTTISGSDDIEVIEKLIADLPLHKEAGNLIVVNNWKPFERTIKDRPITRLALAKGLR